MPVVLSSSWRILYSVEEMQQLLFRTGWSSAHLLVDATDRQEGDEIRGDQIKAWLDAHPEIKRYVIIDDETDFHEDQKQHLIQTNPALGLTDEDVIKIQNKLEITL